ncbi:sensor histidine kinase, partial [Bacillus cereus group sp. m1-22]
IIFEKRRESLLEVIQFNILIYISILIALYLKDYLDFTFRKILYNHKKNYTNSLNRFMHQTKKEYEVKKIIKFIKREVKDVLSVTNPICISVNNMSNKISFFEKEQSISLSKLHKFNWNSYGIGSIIYIEGYSVIVIAILPDYRVVLLAKGKKFNIDEIVWLETLANYANLQFECLRKIEILAKSLEHVNFDTNYPAEYARFSFMIAEKERENLSRDIHDGILQDQLRLYRKIEVREKKETNEEFKVTLRQIREQIIDHIYITRETCNNLRPPFLEELGLEKALLNLIKKINREANFLLDYKIEKELRIYNSEISHCIYRVTQELLNNAIKHSQATVVKLRLFEQNNYLCLYYVDDGIGMGIGKQVGDLRSTIGIPGVIARVRGLHGSVSIDSTHGSGVRIKIKFNKDSVYK